jgi:glycosyltransferase involved in cell wall biosynthesis
MNIPRISVLMSVYNGGIFLRECVESVLNQSFKLFEFIIVDDGSTDNTWETLVQYAERDARIVLLRNQPNMGVVRALNKGLEHVRAEIIARQDADDISHPERLQKQLAFLDTHPEVGLVAAVPRLIAEDGTPLESILYTATENDEIQELLLDSMCLCGPTIMVRRKCLEEAGFYFAEGLDASEDYDICLRVAEVTKLASLEGYLYQYRQQPESASSKRAARQMFNKAIALERAVSRRYGDNPPPEKLVTMARDYLHAAIIAFARDDLGLARCSLDEVLRLYPPILQNEQPLEDLIRAYTPKDTFQRAFAYTDSIFRDLFPDTKFLAGTRSRLLSYLHMSLVFEGAKQKDFAQVDQHLWDGIRCRPSWILNKGVMAIVIKRIFGRIIPSFEKR